MNKRKKLRLGALGLAVAGLAGLAWWYFQSKTAAPQAAPVAQASSPAAEPAEEPRPSEEAPAPATPGPLVTVAPTPAPQALRPVSPEPAPIPVQAVTANEPTAPQPTPALSESSRPQITEAQGTAQMYAAHASLRTPEVADPDSVSNRRIFQTMVVKSLAQRAANPPQPTAAAPSQP